MPQFRSILQDDQTKIGIWHITEPATFFSDKLILNKDEMQELSSFKNERRKTEWLSARYVLHQITESPERWSTSKDKFGKPFFNSTKNYLSISHTDNYAAAMIHDLPCGIDIQLKRDLVLKILKRVLSQEELHSIPPKKELLYGTLYWSAKEAIFKAYGKGNLDYRKDITVKPFNLNQNIYYTTAFLNFSGMTISYSLQGFLIDDNIVVTAVQNI